MTNPAAGESSRGALVGRLIKVGSAAHIAGLIKPDHSNFGPRVGFAYSINSKTVVRGGYGLYYARWFTTISDAAEKRVIPSGRSQCNFGFDAFIRLSTYPRLPSIDPTSQFSLNGCAR